MNIILNELKKIFNIKSIILLLLINIIMYFMFIEFDIKYFPNGRPATDDYNIFVEMADEYGKFMDEVEFEDFIDKYQKVKKEADEYIDAREDFKELGINNYDEFIEIDVFSDSRDENHKKALELWNDVIFEKKIDAFWEIPSRERFIESYQNREEYMTNRGLGEKNAMRVKEILENDIETSVLPDVVFSNYDTFIKSVAMTILLSVMFIITPIYLRDNKEKINYLQYTSKTGRKLFKKKIIAGLLATFILVSIQFICFLSIYYTNNTSMFFNSNINSVFNSIISWYDLTFLHYITITVVGTYILAFVFSFISMFVSSISQNYIAVIGIQLPIALFTFAVLLKYLIQYMTSINYPKYFSGLSYVILMIIGSIVIIIRWKKEKKADVLY